MLINSRNGSAIVLCVAKAVPAGARRQGDKNAVGPA
jgi:hypothetical protein